jgi:hypothetical protein
LSSKAIKEKRDEGQGRKYRPYIAAGRHRRSAGATAGRHDGFALQAGCELVRRHGNDPRKLEELAKSINATN